MKFEKRDDGSYLLDVQGFVCPHPQIYTKKALEKVNPGDVICVEFDNPSSGDLRPAPADGFQGPGQLG